MFHLPIGTFHATAAEGDRKVACSHASVSPGPLQYAGGRKSVYPHQEKHAPVGCLGREVCLQGRLCHRQTRPRTGRPVQLLSPAPNPLLLSFMSPLFGEHESLHQEKGNPLNYGICHSLSMAFSRCVPVHHKASDGHLHL